MKLIRIISIFIVLALNMTAYTATITATMTDAKSTYQDIQKTFGIVPAFMKSYPEEGISAAWEEYKKIQLNPYSELTGKEKELIGLGVAAQIPCNYCIYMHTEAAKLNGATEQEIKETIAMAAATRHWSTYLSGIQYNEIEFQKETDKIIAFLKKGMEAPSEGTPTTTMKPMVVTDSITAYQDIEHTLGSVPNVFRQLPQEGVAGAWKMMKSIQLNSNTELSAKEKELISLAVGAQVPCGFCTYFNTENAKLNGASTEEIRESIAVASLTRFWSTVLNGNQVDEARFKKETGQIIRFLKSQNVKKVGVTKFVSNKK